MVDFFGFAPSKINKTGGACPLLSLVLQDVIQQITHETTQNKIKDFLQFGGWSNPPNYYLL